MTAKLTRRDLLRRSAPAIIVGAATPLWAQWLAQEMRKLNRKWFQVPRGEARTFVAFDPGYGPDKTAVALFERDADGNLMVQAYDDFMTRKLSISDLIRILLAREARAANQGR